VIGGKGSEIPADSDRKAAYENALRDFMRLTANNRTTSRRNLASFRARTWLPGVMKSDGLSRQRPDSRLRAIAQWSNFDLSQHTPLAAGQRHGDTVVRNARMTRERSHRINFIDDRAKFLNLVS
jgi:hypothetical protein